MTNTDDAVGKRIFVKVFGFSDEERQALYRIFQLSETRFVAYALWTEETRQAPELMLVDGESWEAALELAHPLHDLLTLIWVGGNAPGRARLVLTRPLDWAAVIETMDDLLAQPTITPVPPRSFAAANLDLDLDLSLEMDPDFLSEASGSPDGHPGQALAASAPAVHLQANYRPVLVVDVDRQSRLYLRARLAEAGLMQVDEALSGAEALRLISTRRYKLVILDMNLFDMRCWQVLKQVTASRPAVDFLILTGRDMSRLDRLRGWFAGARGCLRKPLHPGRLKQLLAKVA
ncbi:Response regulator receiver domain-containing protein [Polaromonas sp. OV174]|uniref:response regulator n=1 Tax=Polaromonas sp. OV174 TaxID=1855300 RepID=UPI0008F3EE5E|nr:response regulator [Polaromonas sp. OV174]SFC67326.1 Response regulator receiver domain-containing protein [Polaromonas sp. OV174]